MLAIEPVDEVKSLRYHHDGFADIPLSANEERVLDSVGGKAIEIDLTVDMGTAREVGVYVLRITRRVRADENFDLQPRTPKDQ